MWIWSRTNIKTTQLREVDVEVDKEEVTTEEGVTEALDEVEEVVAEAVDVEDEKVVQRRMQHITRTEILLSGR